MHIGMQIKGTGQGLGSQRSYRMVNKLPWELFLKVYILVGVGVGNRDTTFCC